MVNVNEDDVAVGSVIVKVRTIVPLNDDRVRPSTTVRWGDGEWRPEASYTTPNDAARGHLATLRRLTDFTAWSDELDPRT